MIYWCFVIWKCHDGTLNWGIGGYDIDKEQFYVNYGLGGLVIDESSVVAWSLFESVLFYSDKD